MDDTQDAQTTDIQPVDLQPTDLVNMEDEPQVASQLLNLESTIKTYIKSLASLRAEMREKNSQLEDSCNNDTRYFQEDEKVKEATRVKTEVRESILKQPGLINTSNEIKEIRQKIKDQIVALEKYLQQFLDLAKTNQIVTDDGEIHEIVVKRVLKKKSSKYNP